MTHLWIFHSSPHLTTVNRTTQLCLLFLFKSMGCYYQEHVFYTNLTVITTKLKFQEPRLATLLFSVCYSHAVVLWSGYLAILSQCVIVPEKSLCSAPTHKTAIINAKKNLEILIGYLSLLYIFSFSGEDVVAEIDEFNGTARIFWSFLPPPLYPQVACGSQWGCGLASSSQNGSKISYFSMLFGIINLQF